MPKRSDIHLPSPPTAYPMFLIDLPPEKALFQSFGDPLECRYRPNSFHLHVIGFSLGLSVFSSAIHRLSEHVLGDDLQSWDTLF